MRKPPNAGIRRPDPKEGEYDARHGADSLGNFSQLTLLVPGILLVIGERS